MSGSKFYKNESNQTCKKHHGKLIAVLFAVIGFGAAFLLQMSALFWE
ncbi:MAG: hypothetical protein SPJ89_11270 [Treponema sp.]|nr:hypothetical protein [Spirochaetia bacterium]MDD7460319.1 hypothetical protein [Spirochaetales bacterium]MDY5812546.1 hypothetical protein [Treponema sp.]